MLTKKNSTKQQRRQLAVQQAKSKLTREKKTKRTRPKTRKQIVSARPGTSITKDAYANCRLRPFQAMGNSQGIPDGTAIRRLVLDHRLTTTLTFGSTGTLNLVLAPALPSPLWVQATDAGVLINGETHSYNNPNALLYVPVVFPEWSLQTMDWEATAGKFNNCHTLFSSGKFRLVTLGWSLSYVGTSLTNSGVIKASSATIGCGEPFPNPAEFTIFSSRSGTNTNVSSNQVLISTLDAPFLGSSLSQFTSQSTRIIPLREGASGILRHSGSGYEFKRLSQDQRYMTLASGTENYSFLMQTVATPLHVKDSGVVQGIDTDWDLTILSITGGTSGQAVVLDMIVCVEYCPQPDSSAFPLAKTAPSGNDKLISQVEETAKRMPVAEVGEAIGTALSVGKLVATLF